MAYWDDEDDIDYSEVDGDDEYESEEDIEEEIQRFKKINPIGRGDCLLCNSKNSMENDGQGFFFCSECNGVVDEDLYYRWAAGYPVDISEE